jgi:hypothetical protein
MLRDILGIEASVAVNIVADSARSQRYTFTATAPRCTKKASSKKNRWANSATKTADSPFRLKRPVSLPQQALDRFPINSLLHMNQHGRCSEKGPKPPLALLAIVPPRCPVRRNSIDIEDELEGLVSSPLLSFQDSLLSFASDATMDLIADTSSNSLYMSPVKPRRTISDDDLVRRLSLKSSGMESAYVQGNAEEAVPRSPAKRVHFSANVA